MRAMQFNMHAMQLNWMKCSTIQCNNATKYELTAICWYVIAIRKSMKYACHKHPGEPVVNASQYNVHMHNTNVYN